MSCFGQSSDAALLRAASAGDTARVLAALRRGASLECRDSKLGGTALGLASLNGHAATVAALLQHSPRPDLRAKDRVGDSAAHWAALNGHTAVLTLLLAHGADATDRNYDGDTPLDMAGRGVGVDARTAEAVRGVLRAAAPAHVRLLPLARDARQSSFRPNVDDTVAPAAHADARPTDVRIGEDWAIDTTQLQFLEKLASGSFGDVYRGTYRGSEVAIKALRLSTDASDAAQAQVVKEFMGELSVLRKVRHKHMVQLIGASAGPAGCLLITEYMRAGSLLMHLQRHRQPRLPAATQLRMALDVSRGMDYLHACNIIHRDLKAANLLLSEHGDVKVADFGLARVVDGANAGLTAETGTYRWMAPEVILHSQYDGRADVYSFAIVLWEIATAGLVPYSGLNTLQVALRVAQEGLRPSVPHGTHAVLAATMVNCWHAEPAKRPAFSALVLSLDAAAAHAEKTGGV